MRDLQHVILVSVQIKRTHACALGHQALHMQDLWQRL